MNWLFFAFCCLLINLKTPKVAPLNFFGGYTVPIFPNKIVLGFTCPALAHVGLYSMYLSSALLTNAPMPQPLSDVCSVV